MDTHLKRMIGAQFKGNLGKQILVFLYPHPAPHLFHTMWCPPLRVVVLDVENANGNVLFDQIVRPWSFIRLPAGRVILEMDPDDDYKDVLHEIVSTGTTLQNVLDCHSLIGGTDSNVSVGGLLFAMLADALRDLRGVKMTCLDERGLLDPAKLVQHYPPWERGRILASAGFVLDFSPETTWRIPEKVIPLSADVLKFENAYADELLAASNAAVPSWKSVLDPICIGCGDIGSWRPILPVDAVLPTEKSWRLLRPENNVPLCNYCEKRFKITQKADIRHNLAHAFWGARFEALNQWFNLEMGGGEDLPKQWDKAEYPLWPMELGGDTWETGSGAVKYVTPLWPKCVKRTEQHISFLKETGLYNNIIRAGTIV